MKASTIVKKVAGYSEKIAALLEPVNQQLIELLDDQCAHVCLQAGDGAVIAYGGGFNNSKIDRSDLDVLLKMSKEEALSFLDRNAI